LTFNASVTDTNFWLRNTTMWPLVAINTILPKTFLEGAGSILFSGWQQNHIFGIILRFLENLLETREVSWLPGRFQSQWWNSSTECITYEFNGIWATRLERSL